MTKKQKYRSAGKSDHAFDEAMHMIRKGQVRWLAKGDIAEQIR
jgi:hypothetical protein